MQNFQYDLFLQLLEFNELSIIDYKIWDSLNLPQLEYYIFKRDRITATKWKNSSRVLERRQNYENSHNWCRWFSRQPPV